MILALPHPLLDIQILFRRTGRTWTPSSRTWPRTEAEKIAAKENASGAVEDTAEGPAGEAGKATTEEAGKGPAGETGKAAVE